MAHSPTMDDSALTFPLSLACTRLRARRGCSQAELARRSGMSPSDYNKLERGRREFGLKSLYAVARGLGLQVHALMYYAETGRLCPKVPSADRMQIRQRVSHDLEQGRPDLEHLAPQDQRAVVGYELGMLDANLHVERFMAGDWRPEEER